MIINETKKFKTVVVSVRFKEIITKEKAGLRSLLPNVMSSVTPLYKTRKQLNEALENLYGGSVSARTYKIGKLSIIDFSLILINPSLMEEGFFEEGLLILNDIIYGHKNLPKKEFELEKRLQLERIASVKNNKTSLAIVKLFSEMFKEQRYSIRTLGTTDDVNNITYEKLNKYYNEVINENDIDVVISGSFTENDKVLINKYFNSKNRLNASPIDEEETPINEEVKVLSEPDEVSQVKLNIGYNLPVKQGDRLQNATSLFNVIFGQSAHSRLFLTVREKHSLCYYINSVYDSYKGFMYVYAGIDKDKLALARSLIAKELHDLKTNLITDLELEQSKKYLINALKESEDDQNIWMNSLYQQTLLNRSRSLEERITAINKITKEEVLEAALLVKENTVFLMVPEVK